MKYSEFFKLIEKKDHIIRKTNLTDEQKQIAIDFFKKYPSYENELGTKWSNPEKLTWEDFEAIINKTRVSGNQLNNFVKEGIHYITLFKSDDFVCYQPLTWFGARYLASKDVAPYNVVGKWCIAKHNDRSYWDEYTFEDRDVFIFYFDLKNSKKYAFEIPSGYDSIGSYAEEIIDSIKVWDQNDIDSGWYDWVEDTDFQESMLFEEELFFDAIDNYEIVLDNNDIDIETHERFIKLSKEADKELLKSLTKKKSPSTWNKSILVEDLKELGLLVKTDDGYVFHENLSAIDRVNGDFVCSSLDLVSLKNCPKHIDGNFDCGYNKLTSLEGGPDYVGKNYICSDNQITSLEGSPEKIENGYFNCSFNQLENLIGAPRYVKDIFDCSHNQLKSFEGSPDYVGFWDSSGNTEDVKGLRPNTKINGWFDND